MSRYDSVPIDAIRAAIDATPLGWTTFRSFREAVITAADEADVDSLDHLLDILDAAENAGLPSLRARISHARRLALHAAVNPVTR